jgi:cytochrome c-type biogenesis protein CcmH/NrfG
MANTGAKKRKPTTNKTPQTPAKIAGVRAEFAVVLAVVTFVTGFIIGRVSQNATISKPNRELAVEQVQSIIDSPTISDQEWIEELRRQANASSNDATPWTKLGNAYFDTEQFANAIDAYEKSIALAPNDPNVLTDLGIMYRRSGDSNRAIELFDRAAKADANHIMSRFNKGVVMLHDLENPKAAAEAWNQVVAINPAFKSPTGSLVSDMVKALEGNE